MTLIIAMLGFGLNIWKYGSGLGLGTGGTDPLALLDRASAQILDRSGAAIDTRV